MSHRRDDIAFLRAHRVRENHEWRFASMFEILSRDFLQHGGRKRAPPFTKFYGVIHLGVHFRIARIGQNRAMPQSARAKFHSSLEPADNFSIGEKLGGVGAVSYTHLTLQ